MSILRLSDYFNALLKSDLWFICLMYTHNYQNFHSFSTLKFNVQLKFSAMGGGYKFVGEGSVKNMWMGFFQIFIMGGMRQMIRPSPPYNF